MVNCLYKAALKNSLLSTKTQQKCEYFLELGREHSSKKGVVCLPHRCVKNASAGELPGSLFYSLTCRVEGAGVKWLCSSQGTLCVLMQLSWAHPPASRGELQLHAAFAEALKHMSRNAERLTQALLLGLPIGTQLVISSKQTKPATLTPPCQKSPIKPGNHNFLSMVKLLRKKVIHSG